LKDELIRLKEMIKIYQPSKMDEVRKALRPIDKTLRKREIARESENIFDKSQQLR